MSVYYYNETDLLNWELDHFLESKKFQRQPLFSWLTLFPEIVGYHKEKLDELKKKLKSKLVRSYELLGDSWRGKLLRIGYMDTIGRQINQISKAFQQIHWRDNPKKSKNGITNLMIEKARQFDITKLIENKRGMALCFNHPDKRPSLNLKNNFAYCHSCGYSADVIKFYMDLNNVDFKTAVKSLN